MNNISIPYNDVFFYGLSMKSRDINDVRGDIFSNILMKYLTSLKPVSGRLYRVADNSKYEYSYSFIPSKPISWRVIKNRRVIEDVEKMTEGKFCLNYYDDNGRDVKRVIFNNQKKWIKTNYYNSVYGEALVCSLVPKEINGETAILQYVTGDPYPITLHSCPIASNSQVMQNVLARVPEPEVTALTNYGLMYFASEETLKLYNQVLSEEERKFSEASKPQVFNTKEDVVGGFCFDVSSFDSTRTSDSVFDLQSAEELTEEGFIDEQQVLSVDEIDQMEIPSRFEAEQISEDYSVEDEISKAIRIISESTNLEIDETLIFVQDESADDASESEIIEPVTDESETDDNISEEPSVADSESEVTTEMFTAESENTEAVELSDDVIDDLLQIQNDEEIVANPLDDSLELLNMDDEAIDDYVSTLIDSILLDAKSTAQDFLLDKVDEFAEAESSVVQDNNIIKSVDYIAENTPDLSIESNGLEYYYYGELDADNNRSGRGKTLMADGKTAYEGDYINDMRDGVGSFYFKDGSLCYWGQWSKNQRSGFGIGISSETGFAHIGSWDNNKPTGIGARFDKDGKFMYLDSACHKINGGIRVTGFTDNSLFVEVWDEKTLKVIKKEISLEDLFK